MRLYAFGKYLCRKARYEARDLGDISQKYINATILFFKISFYAPYETKIKVNKFLKDRKIDFRIIPDIGTYSDILASNFPQTIFVNREGIITDVQNGMVPIYDKKLKITSDKMEETDFINSLSAP